MDNVELLSILNMVSSLWCSAENKRREQHFMTQRHAMVVTSQKS